MRTDTQNFEMVNALTRDLGISFGPIVLETLIKHYFKRLKKDHSVGKGLTQLRKDELLYDQVFNVVKVPIIPVIYQTTNSNTPIRTSLR